MVELDLHSQEAITRAVTDWRGKVRHDTLGGKNDKTGIVFAQPRAIGGTVFSSGEALDEMNQFFDVYTDKRATQIQERRNRGVIRLAGMTLSNITELVENPRVSNIELVGVGDGTLLLDDFGNPIDWANPALRARALKQGDATLFTFPRFLPNRSYLKPLLPPLSFGFLNPTNIRVTTGPLDPEKYGQDDEIARAEALRTMGGDYRQPLPKLQLSAQITREQMATVDLDDPSAIAHMIEHGIQAARRTYAQMSLN